MRSKLILVMMVRDHMADRILLVTFDTWPDL